MKKNQKIVIIISLAIALLLIIGGSYATLNFDALIQGKKESKISSCKLSLNFKDENAISLIKTSPISDDKITSYEPYRFSITNNSTCNTAYYKITLKDICTTCTKTNNICTVNGQELNCSDANKIPSSKIKYQLVNKLTDETILKGNPEKMKITGTIAKGDKIKFELKLWIDSSATNKDLYVYENGKPKENADGSIVTKNAGYKINIESQDKGFTTTQTDTEKLIKNVGTGGLVGESHPATEQLGETIDYRYTGANPDNYVSFNNELWRIIGIFIVDDGTGNFEPRIKLIRKDSIGEIAWTSSPTIDWTNATSKKLLNSGDYWNRTGSYASNGLTEVAKSMIDDAKWYLGGTDDYTSASNGLASHFYNYERGTKVYTSDGIIRQTSWTGKVGLMYPSDYGYATSGGETTNRDSCLATEIYNWNASPYVDCYNNNWLLDKSNKNQLTITSLVSDIQGYVFIVDITGGIQDNGATTPCALHPTVYLSPNIKITGGKGTESDPYQLSL